MFEKFKIESIGNCIYNLVDSKGKKVQKAIIFYDIDRNIMVKIP